MSERTPPRTPKVKPSAAWILLSMRETKVFGGPNNMTKFSDPEIRSKIISSSKSDLIGYSNNLALDLGE